MRALKEAVRQADAKLVTLRAVLNMRPVQKPDPAAHRTGWSAKRIDGRWCVGMTGNLDTIHDAVLIVNNHSSDDDHARQIAEWVAATYSAAN